MARKVIIGLVVSAAIGGSVAAPAGASNPIQLYMSGSAAFAVLGASCGGIQQKVYATGFGANGYPTGNVHLQTTCGGSGRGGGYKSTTYTATASVVWSWFGETRSYGPMQGALEGVSAEDGHGDKVYNVGAVAYLETGNPPLQPPAAPTGISAYVGLYEEGEREFLRMGVGYSVDPETVALIKSSTITATPVNSTAPVLTETVIPYFSSGHLQPVAPSTTYIVTVTSTDAEGTSQSSVPIEIRSPNSDGEAERERSTVESCTSNTGKIKLSPGLTETPTVQSITVNGELGGCNGPLGFEAGKYVAHLKTTEPVACPVLASSTVLPITSAVSFAVKWLPSEEGSSKGSLVLPISEVPLTNMTGTLSGGPFSASTNITAGSIAESFTGGPSCGQTSGKSKVAKPVKAGVFSTGEVTFG
jgi:hypothetical protein